MGSYLICSVIEFYTQRYNEGTTEEHLNLFDFS